MPILSRRAFGMTALSVPLWRNMAQAAALPSTQAIITDFGAKADATTVNTPAIQAAIDHLAAAGGGTVVVPPGVFVSGALFLKPGVNLHLDKEAVLRCTIDMRHFPRRRTRIEGHFEDNFTPALINAHGCDGLTISGEGTLDGAGRPIWDEFWKRRRAAADPNAFSNLSLDRARLALIEKSRGVTIEGITFKDSQFWNLHIYDCEDVTVRGARFVVPDDYVQAPSTDGIDLDSCRKVTVDGCYFSVTDDCIAAKGSKGPKAWDDKDSPPVEHIRIRNCHFRRGHQAFTCGSEATIVRDVIVEDCRVTGAINLLMLKLRPDTPQLYEDIHVRNIALDSEGGRILLIEPWSQYKDLDGQAPPQSIVRNITLSQIKGHFGSFGIVRPNPGQTSIGNIRLSAFEVQLVKEVELVVADGVDVHLQHAVINGKVVKQPRLVSGAPNNGVYRMSGQ